SGGGDKTVRVWDARTGQELAALHGHTGQVTAVAFSPDGQHVLSREAGAGKGLTWDVATGMPVGGFHNLIVSEPGRAARHPTLPIVAVARGKDVILFGVNPPDEFEL